MTRRTRRSGAATVPVRAVQARIDFWRSSPNLAPFRPLTTGPTEPTAWDDSRVIPFVEIEAGSEWIAGWNLSDWSDSSPFGPSDRNLEVVESTRRAYGSATFSDYAFTYIAQGLEQTPGQSTAFLQATDSFTVLERTLAGMWIDGDDAEPTSTIIEAVSVVDQTLPNTAPLGSIPVVSGYSDKNIAWTAREFISPYGFYDQDLLVDPAGIQLVGGGNSDGGFESFGFASPAVHQSHIRLNLTDTTRQTNLPVRSRRGTGSDYYDWLPVSARHVWMCRLPYMSFPPISNNPSAPATTFDYDFQNPRVAQRFPTGVARVDAAGFHAFESFSDRLRERRRAPATIDDIADSEANTRPSFVRRAPWTAPLAASNQTQANRNSSALVSGGLWMGDFPVNTPTAAGDNFVLPKPEMDRLRSVFSEDEFAIEIGATMALGDPDVVFSDFYTPLGVQDFPYRSGYFVERFLLSTSPEGGIQDRPGAVNGEVRPVDGFAVSLATIPAAFSSTNPAAPPREIAVVASLYLSVNHNTSVVRAFRFLPLEMASSNASFRVVVSRKGDDFRITLQAYGVNEVVNRIITEGGNRPGDIASPLSHLSGANFSLATTTGSPDSVPLRLPGFEVKDDVLVIPSVASSRTYAVFSSNPWQRNDGSSRLLLANEYQSIFEHPTSPTTYSYNGIINQRLGFGVCFGGLAIHDSTITDVNDINLPARLHGGLNWSSWLGVGARNSLTDIRRFGITGADYIARLTGIPAPEFIAVYDAETQVYPFSWVQVAAQNARSTPSPAVFPRSYNLFQTRSLGDGVMLGMWKSGNSWNRQRDPSLQSTRGGVIDRPWGVDVERMVDVSEDTFGRTNSPRHLRHRIAGVSTKPLFSTWGIRFESRRFERSDYLASDELDATNALFGPYDPIVTEGPSPKNYSIGVWVTLLDVVPVSSTTIENTFNIWSYGPVASLELASSSNRVYLRARLRNADASNPATYADVVHEVEVTREMMGVPLYVCFGVIEFAVLTNSFVSSSPVYVGGNNLTYMIVDSPDDQAIVDRGHLPTDSTDGTFRASYTANANPASVPAPASLVIEMGQSIPGLGCDFVVGGVDINKWMFNEVIVRGDVSSGSFVFRVFEMFFDPDKDFDQPRLPILREYVFARCNSLWSYTGQARILPDHYGITSIDGVGADVFTEGKLNLQGGIQDDTSATNFNVAAFPSLFLSSKKVDYSPSRVAAYELVRTKDRPSLYEVLDRQVAHAPLTGAGSLADDPDLSYYPLVDVFDEARPSYLTQESAQLMRRFWFGRDVTTPVVPHAELELDYTQGGLAGLRTYPVFTPALVCDQGQVIAINNISDERGAVPTSLESVVDVKGFSELQGLVGVNDSSQVFRPCSAIGEPSSRFTDAARYGEIEFQRLRNESFPYIQQDGSNTILVSLPMYRDAGTPTKTSTPPNQTFEVVRVGFWKFDDNDVEPTPLFPTYSVKWRGDSLETIPTSGETNVLGNLCFERSVASWGFSETSSTSPAYRITTNDLGLVQEPGEPNPDFIARGVWRCQKGGRKLLKRKRPGGPTTAFTGKGRASWARAVYSSTVEYSDGGYFVDTVPPNPLAVIEQTQSSEHAYRALDAVPNRNIANPKRTERGWKRKRGQRAIAEESTGSPTPIVAAADALNPFPSVAASAFQAALFGSPKWTDYSRSLEREFSRTLQAATFTSGEFDVNGLQQRRRMLWVELTGNQFFPTWLEWARPEGGWGERESASALLPYHAYPFAPLPEVSRAVSPRFAREVDAPVGPRGKYDPARVFERELFNGSRVRSRLLLMDRYSTFDDRFPVVNLGYNYRFVRSIAGRVGPGLNKHPVSTILRHPVEALVHLGPLANSFIGLVGQTLPTPQPPFMLVEESSTVEESGLTSVWNLSGTFTPSIVSGEQFEIVPQEGTFIASSRYGVWVSYDQNPTPLPDPDELYVTDEAAPYTRVRISTEPALLSPEGAIAFAEVPVFYRYAGTSGVNGPIEVVAYVDGDVFGGNEVILNDPSTGVTASTFDPVTGVFAAPFRMHRSSTYQPSGNFQIGDELGVDGEVLVDDEVVLDPGDLFPYEPLTALAYWFSAPSIEQVRLGNYLYVVDSLPLSSNTEVIAAWVQGSTGEPEPYIHTSTFVLEGLLDDLSVDGTVTPLALVNTLNRYTANDSNGNPVGGYLRNTLACTRVADSLLKLWYGTGDNLVRSDYRHWWKDANSFLVDVGTNVPQLVALSEMDAEFQDRAITEYNSVAAEGGPYVPPNDGGNASVWQFPVPSERYATSVRPFGPDARTSRYDNKQFWTRDIRLQDRARAQEVWSTRHSYSHEVMQDVTIQPRGWRYGLQGVTATGSRWAVNPRHWGHMSDLQRACPESARLRSGSVDPCIKVQIVPIGGNIQSRNLDPNYRSFQPFLDVPDPAAVESLAYTRVNTSEVDSVGIAGSQVKDDLVLLESVLEATSTTISVATATQSALTSTRNFRNRLRPVGVNGDDDVFSGAFRASLARLDAALEFLVQSQDQGRALTSDDVLSIQNLGRAVDDVLAVLRVRDNTSERLVPASPSFPQPITYEQAIEYIRTRPVR